MTTGEGPLYLAVVLAVFSRRVVGWSIADHLRAELAMDAVQMARGRRRPITGTTRAGLIHHADHGSEYTALAFRAYGHAADIRCSMGSIGDCADNALAESVCATLGCALLTAQPFRTHTQARVALFAYIECFYNRRRRHSALDDLSPHAYEGRYTPQQQVA